MPDSSFPSKRLTYLLEIIADEAIAGNDAIFHNARTGHRYMAVGDPTTLGGSLELRFVPASADVQANDLLTTSGVDGIYPAGLHVGRVAQVDRRIDTAFARVHAQPMARHRGRHMLVLAPVSDWPERPSKSEPAPRTRKAASAPAAAASSAATAAASAPTGGPR